MAPRNPSILAMRILHAKLAGSAVFLALACTFSVPLAAPGIPIPPRLLRRAAGSCLGRVQNISTRPRMPLVRFSLGSAFEQWALQIMRPLFLGNLLGVS